MRRTITRWSPHGGAANFAAAANGDLRLYEASPSGTITLKAIAADVQGQINDFAWSPIDEDLLAAGLGSGTVVLTRFAEAARDAAPATAAAGTAAARREFAPTYGRPCTAVAWGARGTTSGPPRRC